MGGGDTQGHQGGGGPGIMCPLCPAYDPTLVPPTVHETCALGP